MTLEETSLYWNNEDSIYYHKPGEFLDFIVNIADRSISVPAALQRFRERKCLSKRFKEMKIHELRQNSQLIAELYNGLRNGMQPLGKLSLPVSSNPAKRGPELIHNLSEYGSTSRYGIGLDHEVLLELADLFHRRRSRGGVGIRDRDQVSHQDPRSPRDVPSD